MPHTRLPSSGAERDQGAGSNAKITYPTGAAFSSQQSATFLVCRKLVGAQNRWRIRVGDYRVIYEIDDTDRFVNIIAIRHRSKAYE